jgi:hypothetical protein
MTKHMRCDIDLDWCTYHCPCGTSCCTRFLGLETISKWLQDHKAHTDGQILEHTTEEGNRAWAEPEPDQIAPWPPGLNGTKNTLR